jgi:hypothetical protein
MARRGRRLTTQPGDWRLGLAAGAILVLAIAVIVGAVIFGLVHVVDWLVGYFFGRS